jgi:putative transposase
MQDMYGYEVSSATISSVTDKLIPTITEWRNRSLESIYTVVFLDAMFFKVREGGKVVNKALYNIMGINQDGIKDILGFYVAGSEGANFWLGVLNDLRARGVEDILIACIDGLKGFPEAIQAVFPKTEIQLCVVHHIRNSIKYTHPNPNLGVESRSHSQYNG